MKRALDEEVLDRASVWLTDRRDDGTLVCAFGRWPGMEFTARVDPARVEEFIRRAGEDVRDLWPSRDPRDGAISLLATHLESQLLSLDARPELVELDRDGRWSFRRRVR